MPSMGAFAGYAAWILLLLSPVNCYRRGVNESALPTVDLGYVIQRVSSVQDGVYYFSNIRYAAPPVGHRRFSPAQSPTDDRGKIYDGSEHGDTTCFQSNPLWSIPQNGSTKGLDPIKYISPPITVGTEDCLFLDVLVPKAVFRKPFSKESSSGSPVVIWIHGGGSVQGSKDWYGGLGGLIKAGHYEIVVVKLNYRLAAFGFLNGPSYRIAGGTPNLALLDQRFAFEWVQKHIHFFGGDPTRVTIMGQSAGGAAVIHHVTAYGGNVRNPFAQAICLSPGWNPTTNHLTAEKTYFSLAVAAGCVASTKTDYARGLSKDVLECLRGKSSQEMAHANQAVVAKAPYGSYGFSPSVDGNLVPDMPTNLLTYGLFDKKLKIMTGQTADETYGYGNASNEDLLIPDAIAWAMPQADPKITDYLGNVLYPRILNSTNASKASGLPYDNNIDRANLMVSDFGYGCNNAALQAAFGGEGHGYLFAIPPAVHALDMVYLFDTAITGQVSNTTTLGAVRSWVSNFVTRGDPNASLGGKSFPALPQYGKDGKLLRISSAEQFEVTHNPENNERCSWWQKVLYVN